MLQSIVDEVTHREFDACGGWCFGKVATSGLDARCEYADGRGLHEADQVEEGGNGGGELYSKGRCSA